MKHNFSNDLQESTKTFKIRSRQLKFNFCLCKWKENQRVPMANLWINYFRNENWNYRISSNNSQGRLFPFSRKKGAIIRGKAIISNIAYWKSCPKDVLFFIFKKIITSNKLNMGFSSVPNLVPWLVFRAWIVTDLAGSGTVSPWQGGHKRERRHGEGDQGGGGGGVMRGRRLVQIFLSKGGDYSRKYGNSQFKSVKKWKYVFQKQNKTKRPRKKRKRDYFC